MALGLTLCKDIHTLSEAEVSEHCITDVTQCISASCQMS